MITDPTYYHFDPVKLPNVAESPAIGTVPSAASRLQSQIDLYEDRFFRCAFTNAQYTIIKNSFTGDVLDGDAPEWVKDLVDGKTLEDGRRWQGLRHTVGTMKVSLLAYFVAYNYRINDNSVYTTVGEVKGKAANSVMVSQDAILATLFNDFVEMYQGRECFWNVPLWEGLYFNTDFGDYTYSQMASISLYEFMQSDTEAYDMSNFRLYGTKNRYGL